MKVIKKLHTWQHPSLLGMPTSEPPVDVVYDAHEYDFWKIENHWLQIGVWDYQRNAAGEEWVEWRIHTQINASMIAKVYEEFISVPEPADPAPREDGQVGRERFDLTEDSQQVHMIRPGNPPVDLGPVGQHRPTVDSPTGEYKRADLTGDPKLQTETLIRERLAATQMLPPVVAPATTEVFRRITDEPDKPSDFFDDVMQDSEPPAK